MNTLFATVHPPPPSSVSGKFSRAKQPGSVSYSQCPRPQRDRAEASPTHTLPESSCTSGALAAWAWNRAAGFITNERFTTAWVNRVKAVLAEYGQGSPNMPVFWPKTGGLIPLSDPASKDHAQGKCMKKKPKQLKSTDYFGQILMTDLRDSALDACQGILSGIFDSPGHKEYQQLMAGVPKKYHDAILKLCAYVIDGGINDFLFQLDEDKNGGRIKLSELDSIDLHQNLFCEDGWIERFSKYPES